MYQKQCAECKTMLPVDARFCIECSAEQANTGATERLHKILVTGLTYEGDTRQPQSLEERALYGEGDLLVTRAEYYKILQDYRTYVFVYEGDSESVRITRYMGRNIIIAE
jgi:hypothetical protein